MTPRIGGCPLEGIDFITKALDVEVDLRASEDEPERRAKVRRPFVRRTANRRKAQAGKYDRAVFLTTAIRPEAQRILELCALRGVIEVSFEEARQRLADPPHPSAGKSRERARG